MEIKIKMHSQLEDELKPNLRLIKNAIAQIKFENAEVDKNKLAIVIANAEEIDTLKDKIIFLNREIKAACGDERKALVEKRKEYKEEIANLLDSALLNLNEAGGGDYYHYNFLGKEIQVIDEKLKFAHRNAELIDIKNGTLEYKADFDRLSKGARCKNGFKCHESCGIRVGPELTSEV